MKGFWLFPGILEGLGSSGRLVGTISAYPGTSPMLCEIHVQYLETIHPYRKIYAKTFQGIRNLHIL